MHRMPQACGGFIMTWGIRALLVLGVALTSAFADRSAPPQMNTQLKTLWTIGQLDGTVADLALDPADFVKSPTQFPVGPMYVVGRSSSKHDWPHVHPGPLDTWAGAVTDRPIPSRHPLTGFGPAIRIGRVAGIT